MRRGGISLRRRLVRLMIKADMGHGLSVGVIDSWLFFSSDFTGRVGSDVSFSIRFVVCEYT